MHPAFSVIFFSTLTGLGYGLWIWTGTALLAQRLPPDAAILHLWLLAVTVVPVAVGLVSSTFHLGKPLRAWRAFSQWRSSWLSREGVSAIAAFVAWGALMCGFLLDVGDDTIWAKGLLVVLVLLSLATVVCTAMIYASLKPVPAWTHRTVVPMYVGFALLTGGLVVAALLPTVEPAEIPLRVLALLLLAVALVVGKRRYWHDLDRGVLPATRSSALGLPADRTATVFERPHTEASYLTKEMGFVVARKHSKRLRTIALVLFGALPVLACALSLLWPPLTAPALGIAAPCALLGALVERWLFFAEAKHLVTLYY